MASPNIKIVLVERALQFEITEHGFRVRDYNDFPALLQELCRSNILPLVTEVVWMWSFSRRQQNADVQELVGELMAIAASMQQYPAPKTKQTKSSVFDFRIHEKINPGRSLRGWCVTSMANVIQGIDQPCRGTRYYLIWHTKLFQDVEHGAIQGSVWSFIRSAAQTQVWEWKLIDLALSPSTADIQLLYRCICAGKQREDEWAIRNG